MYSYLLTYFFTYTAHLWGHSFC